MTHAPSFRDLTALLKVAISLFGDPAALADARTIERREATTIGACLGLLEAFARALLVVLALALPRPAIREQRAAQLPRPGKSVGSGDEPRSAAEAESLPMGEAATASGVRSVDEAPSMPTGASASLHARAPSLCDALPPASERWPGVSFRIVPTDRRAGYGGGGDRVASRFVSTRSLALRFEALCRVAENPERYALRLARRIWKGELDARSALAARLLRPPAPSKDTLGAREPLAVSREAAWLALERALC